MSCLHKASTYPSLTILSELILDPYINPIALDDCLELPSRKVPSNYLSSNKICCKYELQRYHHVVRLPLKYDVLEEFHEDPNDSILSKDSRPSKNSRADELSCNSSRSKLGPNSTYSNGLQKKFIRDIRNNPGKFSQTSFSNMHSDPYKDMDTNIGKIYLKPTATLNKIQRPRGDKLLFRRTLHPKLPQYSNPAFSTDSRSQIKDDNNIPAEMNPFSINQSEIEKSQPKNEELGLIPNEHSQFETGNSTQGMFKQTIRNSLTSVLISNQIKGAGMSSRLGMFPRSMLKMKVQKSSECSIASIGSVKYHSLADYLARVSRCVSTHSAARS